MNESSLSEHTAGRVTTAEGKDFLVPFFRLVAAVLDRYLRDISADEDSTVLEANVGELSPAIPRQLIRDIVSKERKSEAESSAKARGGG